MNIEMLFKNRLRYVKLNLSAGTYRHDRGHSNHFLKWCYSKNVVTTSDITEDLLIDYITDMRKTCVNRTINKRIGVIKRTFKYSDIKMDFLYSLEKFKEDKTEIEIIDYTIFTEMRKLVLTMSEHSEIELLRKTLLALLLSTGARIREIRYIEKKNINFNDCSILLTTTKTKVHRYIYFTENFKPVILKMAEASKSKYLLFDSSKNSVVTYEFARYLMILLEDHFNVSKINTHMFRHTIGAYLHDNEVSDIVLQQILGHSDIATTKIYAHPRKVKVQDIYNRNMKKLD